MLARRIIPCLDVRDGRVVKGRQFAGIKDVDDPARLGRKYSDEGADELVFYDITASAEARQISMAFVEAVAAELHIPFMVGGGINTLADAANILKRGADKISVNSGAVRNPNLIREAAEKFGAQCVVLSMDVRKEGAHYRVYVDGGRTPTELDAINWARQAVTLGAGEIVLNAMDQDGMTEGFDIALLQAVGAAVNVPIIASGGAGTLEHFYEAASRGQADGLLAASVFHFGTFSIAEVKDYLHARGVVVRR
ncbi:MAG: imidazole glycerol phosphate synthase subunit HisF [Acholeplasmatales bacterium]|nr:MAG: imidazole glycerol phosphate synthase subunit HisF [Acholeplasmatales bacterium]